MAYQSLNSSPWEYSHHFLFILSLVFELGDCVRQMVRQTEGRARPVIILEWPPNKSTPNRDAMQMAATV